MGGGPEADSLTGLEDQGEKGIVIRVPDVKKEKALLLCKETKLLTGLEVALGLPRRLRPGLRDAQAGGKLGGSQGPARCLPSAEQAATAPTSAAHRAASHGQPRHSRWHRCHRRRGHWTQLPLPLPGQGDTPPGSWVFKSSAALG